MKIKELLEEIDNEQLDYFMAYGSTGGIVYVTEEFGASPYNPNGFIRKAIRYIKKKEKK